MDSAVSCNDSIVCEPTKAIQGTEASFGAAAGLSGGVVLWRKVADTLSQGLCVFDPAKRLVLFNRRFVEMYRLSPKTLRLGMSSEHVSTVTHAQVDATQARFCDQTSTQMRILRLGSGCVHEIAVTYRADGLCVEQHDDITARVIAEEKLREKTGLLELAQEAAGAGLFDWNLTAGSAHLSPESLGLFNLPTDRTTDVTNAEWASLVHPDDLPGLFQAAEHAVATGSTYRAEFRIPAPDEPDRWILGVGKVIQAPTGGETRIVGLNIDLTERKAAEETQRAQSAAWRESEERLALAMDAASDGLWDLNFATGAAWFSERWFTMLDYAPGEYEACFQTWEMLVHPEDLERVKAALADHLEGRSATYECEVRMRRKDGSWCWILTRGKVFRRDESGRPTRVVGTHIDIDARKAAESQVAYMACHDALTELPNRRLFQERLDQKLSAVRSHQRRCAVLCLDLDRFKAVNDRFGHSAGDELLRKVASRLSAQMRAEDILARLGGDEFAILINDPQGPAQVSALASRLIAAVEAPVALGANLAEVGLSIGIAIAPDHGAQSDGLLTRADLALYRAKAEGRNTHRIFEPAMDDRAAESRRMEQDLRLALRRGELVVHYQPQLRCATGEIVGLEALVRWQHPLRGLVLPGAFIPLAEESGLIVELGAWVLQAACAQAAGWATKLKVAVNVSPRQIQHADMVDLVSKVLAETGLAPSRLELEITEGVIINDMAGAATIMHRLKALGVRIAMDDFGTGHSSLATLQAVPFDRIKIDRSFVGKVETSPQAAAIVRAVLGLGRSLGMGVVGEGVETEGQRRFLIEEACEEMQGFLFGMPQPIGAFRKLLGPVKLERKQAVLF